ncbi:hypothetical protein CLOM_g3874 [Closterium sp. NIES-68]|nr:hypothetical protein CLOM_g3874 [Closterium sp. NIES-68]GJP66842.1 hypothetical protein CLOP_g23730 [Closterium sp. NIES-67]
MAPSLLSSSFSTPDGPRPILSSSSSLNRANLCARQHSIVFSVSYDGRTVSICVACALLDFLVKLIFFIPRFILVLASFGVPLLLLPVGSLIDLTSPPMLVAQAVALIWYTCYLPGLQTLQSKRDSFNRKRRMLQAVEARKTRNDTGDSRNFRAEIASALVTSPAKSCAATEMGHRTCEDEAVNRRSIRQRIGENLQCLRRLACEKATFASRGLRHGLDSAKNAITCSCWRLMVSARVTVTTTVTTAAATVTATAAATARWAAMSAQAAVFTCAQLPGAATGLAVRMLAATWMLLVTRMQRRQLASDSTEAEGSAEGSAELCAREAGERTRKRGKGRKGARHARGGGGKAEFEALEHNGCDNDVAGREEGGKIEQSREEESENDVAALQAAEIPEVSEISEAPELVEGLLEEKEASAKERLRKRAVRKQRRARRERATSEALQEESMSDAEATPMQADVELTQQDINVKSGEEQLPQLTRLTPPELSQLIDQLKRLAAGQGCDSGESDSNDSSNADCSSPLHLEPTYATKPKLTVRQSRQSKSSSDASMVSGWESSSSSCCGGGSSGSDSNIVSRSSSGCSSSASRRSGGSYSGGSCIIGQPDLVAASTLPSPYTLPSSSTSFPTSSLPTLSPSLSSLTLPSPVSPADMLLPSSTGPTHLQPWQHHHQQQQQQQQSRAAVTAAAAQWEMWGSPHLNFQNLLLQQGEEEQGNANTNTSSLCWSPDDKPWLPSPTPLSSSLKAPGMPASRISTSGFDWLEREGDGMLPPPAVPVHVEYPAAGVLSGGVPPPPLGHYYSITAERTSIQNNTGFGSAGHEKQQQRCVPLGSLLPGSLFERNDQVLSSPGDYALLGSGFAERITLEDVLYTREAIEEWVL